MVETVANGQGEGSSWEGVLQFKDAAGKNQYTVQILTKVRQTGSVEFPIRAAAGKPLTFSVVSIGETYSSKYNVCVVVEQLM
jgi:hypothetical protein